MKIRKSEQRREALLARLNVEADQLLGDWGLKNKFFFFFSLFFFRRFRESETIKSIPRNQSLGNGYVYIKGTFKLAPVENIGEKFGIALKKAFLVVCCFKNYLRTKWTNCGGE